MKLLFIFLFSAITALAQTPEWSRKYHTGSVTCLDFSSDGGKLLSGGLDSTVKLWNVFQGDTVRTYKSSSIQGKIDNVDFSKNGEWFIASWAVNSRDGQSYTSFFNIDSNVVVKNLLCTPSPDAKLYDPSKFISYLIDNDSNLITCWGGSYLLTQNSGSTKGVLSRFRIDSNISKHIAFTSYPRFAIADRDKERIAINNTIFDIIKTGNSKFISGEYLQAFAFLNDENKFLASEGGGQIFVWDYISMKKSSPGIGPRASITALAADLKNRYYIISANLGSTLSLWTPGISDIYKKIPIQSEVTAIAVSPDSVRFATAHTDGTVAIWNIDSLAHYAVEDTIFTDISENPFKNTTLSAEPNPFKNSTTIRFSLPKPLKVKLAVTDILGREVVVLKDEFAEFGEQNIVFKNENMPDGTYFITLSGAGLLQTIPVQITR